MPVSNELLEYQQADAEIRKIRQALSSTEESKKYLQAKKFMRIAPEKLAAQEDRAVELKRLRDRLAAQAEEINNTIAEYADLEEMLEGGGDLAYYRKSAQTLLDAVRTLRADVNRLLSDINAVSEEYQKLKRQTIAMQRQYKEYKEKYEAIEAEHAGELKTLTEQQSRLAKKIQPNILEVYENKRKEKIFPIVVPLKEGRCVCGMDFPLAQQGTLAGGNMVECEHCHRLVYKL